MVAAGQFFRKNLTAWASVLRDPRVVSAFRVGYLRGIWCDLPYARLHYVVGYWKRVGNGLGVGFPIEGNVMALGRLFVWFGLLIATASAQGEDFVWRKLATEAYRGKQDDIQFITPKLGWYVNGGGKIFKTVDAGQTWELKLHKPGTYFRCLMFVDEKLGFAGNIGPDYFPNVTDAAPLYRTRDGGETWEVVQGVEAPAVVGLCSMQVLRVPYINAGNLDERIRLIAVGRVGGPAVCIVSDDLGETWKHLSLPKSCAMGLDVHFFDFDRGYIASASDKNVQDSTALVIGTEDGGKTWREVYKGTRSFELTWKMSFPSKDIGFVTVQSYQPDDSQSKRFVLKTEDGGKSWKELLLVDDFKVREFGIAFIDEKRGWVGAMPHGFKTEDGGESWQKEEFGNAVNKIRVLKDETGTYLHAIGVEVHRLEIAKQGQLSAGPSSDDQR